MTNFLHSESCTALSYCPHPVSGFRSPSGSNEPPATNVMYGNMVGMPHLNYMHWDYDDNLSAASNYTFYSYYSYDEQGNRTRKVVVKGNIREERYYLDGYELFRKFENGGLVLERYTTNLADDEKVFARIDEGGHEGLVIRYQYDNHLGSACLELDEHADIISYEEYHPFGTTSYRSRRSETEVSLKRYRYCGKERDEETGLYYYGMRYYAAWLCRFVSVDSLQFEYPYYTPYQYAGNKPITYIDLDGAEEMKPERMKLPWAFSSGKYEQTNTPSKSEETESKAEMGTVYLIDLQKGEKSVNTQEVINLTNKRFEELGMQMKVTLVPKSEHEKFISQELKASETYAVLGNVTDVLNYIKKKDPDGFNKTFSDWEGGAYNPERARNVVGQKAVGMAIDATGIAKTSTSLLGVKAESFVSLSIMHGVGHNAGLAGHEVVYPIPNLIGDKRKGGATIMGDGGWYQNYILAGKHSEIKSIEDAVKKEHNAAYIQEVKRVFNFK